MAFESNNFYASKKVKLPSSEFNVECSIPTEEEISKIFVVSANVSVDTKEVLPGSVAYMGNIETCVVYLTKNGEIGSVHASCPFNSKIESEEIQADQKVLLFVKISGYNVQGITNGNISLNYTLLQTGASLSNQEIKSVSANDEDIAVKEEEIKVVKFIGQAGTIANTKSPFQTKSTIKKLLLCESQASVKDVEPGLNFVTVSGEVVSRVLYLTEDDRFESEYIFDSFKEEIELDGVTKESQAEACAFVKYSDVKAVVDNLESGAKIEVSVPVEICAMAYQEVEVKVVSDLYSTKNELEVSTASFNMTKNLPFEVVDGKIDGTLVIEDDKPRIDKVLFNGGDFVNITNVYVRDGMLNVEGIAKTNVVYLNDEESSLNAVEIEVPFVLSERTEISESAQLYALAIITDSDVAVKKGRELFYDAKVKVLVYVDCDVVSAVISDAKLSDELAQRDYAMEIVFAKEGQTCWDIAKANKVKESMVAMQNPNVIFPLSQNCEIVLFFQNFNKM